MIVFDTLKVSVLHAEGFYTAQSNTTRASYST